MQVLTVSHFYEAHGGGIERVAGQLCRQFAAAGHEVVWAASDADALPGGAIIAVPLRCIDPTEALTGLPMPIPGWRGLRALIREVGRSDVVIVHDSLYITSICAMLAARLRRRKVVLIQHIAGIAFASPVLLGMMALANRLVTRPMLRAADRLVFISDTVRRDLLGEPAWRDYRLVFNGVDGTLFHPPAAEQAVTQSNRASDPDQPNPPPPGEVAARRADGGGDIPGSYDFAPQRPEGAGSTGVSAPILFVGRFVEKKGLAVLRALATLRPDLTFHLVGSGPIAPAGWGLANVHDLGPRNPQPLADLYRSAALLLLPSVGEGYPLVIQEAMACGLPVICGEPSNRADPAAAAWLKGVAIDLSDPEGSARRCADAIDGLRRDAGARTAMADYARVTYSWGAMAEMVLG